MEREAGSIPAQLAAECRVVAAAAKVSETKGAGEETAKDVGADGSSAGADGSSAVAIAGSSASEPVPPEYSLPATNLLRSLDALERPGRSVPPLGFPAWSLRWPAAAAAHASLMPLLELHSVATQPALLAKLTRRVALRAAEEARKTGQTNEEKETEEDEHLQTFQNVSDPDDAEAVSAIVEAASSGMAFGVAAAPRDPSDFAAHRHVLWLLADDPSANGTRRRRASAEASLPALAGSAWRSWHASCWGGAGETMPLAHAPRAFRKRRVVGEAPKDDATFESDVAACHAASRWRAAEGPRRREVALATGIATALVGEGCGATGVAARAIRTAQLRLAARALRLRTPSSRAASAAEWASIGALVAQILVAHAPAAGNRGGRVTLARAAADLVAWCDVEGGHVSAEGVKRGGESARELRERLSAACGATTHGPFRALLADVIGPLVETTIAGAADAAMMDAAMMDAAMMDAAMDDARAFADVDAAASRARWARGDRARRGAAWTLLGLARLHLLLPEGTPDPAAATATRLARAKTRLADETRPALAALAWQRRTPGATPPPSRATTSTTFESSALVAEARFLSARVVPRPTPPMWRPMLAETMKFRTTFASVDRVVALIRALERDDATPRDAARARAEAEAWLAAAEPWGERLDVDFRGYEDATEPARLAALELRRGVTLLTHAAPDPAAIEAAERAARGKVTPERAEAAAAAAAAHLLSFPPLSLTLRAGANKSSSRASTAALLASPVTQRALSVAETVARTRDAASRRGGGDGGGASGREAAATSAAKLRVATLRAALAAAEEEAFASGALGPAAWRRCASVFASLSSLWAHARDADAEAEAEANDLFRRRVKPPTAAETLEGDDDATEEAAYRRAFGDHGAIFADLQKAPDEVMTLGDDEDAEGAPAKKIADADDSDDDSDRDVPDAAASAEDKAKVSAAKLAGLLEGELLEEVVATHRRVLGGLAGPPAPPPPPPLAARDASVAAAVASNPTGWWAVSGAPPAPSRFGRALDPDEAVRAVTFARAYEVGTAITRAAGLAAMPSETDGAAATGHLLRAALEHAAVTRAALPADAAPFSRRVGAVVTDGGAAKGSGAEHGVPAGQSAAADLAAGTEMEAYDPAADAAADALGADLNEGGCAGEMHLVVAPVSATRERIARLLEEWPEHPLLSQLAEICDRVLALPLLSPLKQALTGLELLLARAQTWEEGAASHVSLKEELTACAKLALRWRQRELRTWPRLLARAAERHAARAHRTWFALHRLLRPPKKTPSRRRLDADEKLADADASMDAAATLLAGVDASGLTAEERESLRQVTLALEEYVQGSTIGEFRARLDLLWQFHADLAVESRAAAAEKDETDDARANGSSIDEDEDEDANGSSIGAAGAREAALSNVLYNTWRYYVQFLPAVAKQVEAARAPAAQKLRDHAKLAKWEDRGYHAMKTSGEANQRSLHKFVRAFDTALNALVLPALQSANGRVGMGDLPSERGAGELAAANAAAQATAKETRRIAVEAKNKAAADARAKHRAMSSGAYKDETIQERARREVAEEEAAEEARREAEANKRRVVAAAADRAAKAAEETVERDRETTRSEMRETWLTLAGDTARDAANAAEKTAKIAETLETSETLFADDAKTAAAISGISAALRLDDATLYQSRLAPLTRRLGGILGAALPGSGTDVSGAHGAADVDALASAVAGRAVALREDATAKKATKKKALTDLLRALPTFGIFSARKAVPDAHRSPEAWFREPALERPACLDALGDAAVEAFDAADAYYFKSMARTQRLRAVRNAAHTDLSAREVDAACGAVEHLLHILRAQRRAVASAAEAEAALAVVADATEALRADGVPPPQRATREWTVRQRDTLDGLVAAAAAAKLVHKAVSAAESTPMLRPGSSAAGAAAATLAKVSDTFAAARSTLDPFVTPAIRANEGDISGDAGVGVGVSGESAWSAPALATRSLRDALAANFETMKTAARRVESAFDAAANAAREASAGVDDAAPLPGWEPLRALLADATKDAEAFEAGGFPRDDELARDAHSRDAKLVDAKLVDAKIASAAEAPAVVAAAAARFSAEAEAAVAAALVWAQNVKSAADGPERKGKGGDASDDAMDDEDEDETPTMPGTEAALSGAIGASRVRRVAARASAAAAALSEMIDAAHAAAPADASSTRIVIDAAVSRAGELAPMLALIREGIRRALAEYLSFHRASAKLEAVLSSLVVGICAEGFCVPPEEEGGGGEGGEGGKMMDDVAGTGMGEGEGKKDVSDEIEDEEQILGAEDAEKNEDGDDANAEKKDDSRGIEMQNDFEADAKALSDDDDDGEGSDDDGDDEEKDGDDIDKEMGDGEDDENAEVIDEKMWDAEDDDEKDEEGEGKEKGPEKYEKGSTVQKDENQETETRAADEDEEKDGDDDRKKEEKKEEKEKDGPEKDDDRGGGEEDEDRDEDRAEDEPKDENDGVNQEEIEENHGITPKGPEEPEGGDDEEMELPDDIDLDGDGEGEGEDGADDGADDGDDDGQKMDEDVDEGAGEQGERGDGGDDDAPDDANDDEGGGDLEEVLGDDGDDETPDDDEDDAPEEDENAGGAAPDETGGGEDDDGVQAGPSGAGAGGGADGEEEEEDRDASKPGDEGGDAGAGAEGDGREDTAPSLRAPPSADDGVGGDDDDNGNANPPPASQSALPTPGGGGDGGGGGASASAAGDGAAAPTNDPAPSGGGAPPPAAPRRRPGDQPAPKPRRRVEGLEGTSECHRRLGLRAGRERRRARRRRRRVGERVRV